MRSCMMIASREISGILLYNFKATYWVIDAMTESPKLQADWDTPTNGDPRSISFFKNLPVGQFRKEYSRQLAGIVSGFRAYFWIQAVFFALTTGAQLLMLVSVASEEPVAALIVLAASTFSTLMFVWLFALCIQFASLQSARIENQLLNQEEEMRMSDEILDAAKKRAGDSVTVNGDNSTVVFKSKTGDIKQEITVTGSEETVTALALLVETCRGLKNEEALKASEELALAASEEPRDKGKLFALWTKIVSLAPTVGSMVDIAKGIKSLFT